MRNQNWLYLIGIALIVIVADQITKALVVANLALYEQWAPVEALRPYFTFTYVQNTGAAFGLFPDGGVFFTLIAFFVIGIIFYIYRELPEHGWPIRLALGLQLGGAVGNLIDRIRLGYVVDFFDFKFWPVFNIADSGIVVGVISLLVLMWWEERRAARQEAEAKATGSPSNEDELIV
jgi:signal peptidase II